MGNIVNIAMKIRGKEEDCEKIFEKQHFSEYGAKDDIEKDGEYYLYFDGSCNNGIELKPKLSISKCDIEAYESEDYDLPYVKHYFYKKGETIIL